MQLTLMLSLLLTGCPPGVLGWVRGGRGRLLLLGRLKVPPLPARLGWGRPGSLGGRVTTGAVLDVGLCVLALEGPCEELPEDTCLPHPLKAMMLTILSFQRLLLLMKLGV